MVAFAANKQQSEGRWWPVCLGAELDHGKPLAVQCEGQKIALFRDRQGAARALEDRCPHRRVPLSMGRVTPEGQLQCGYHGWTFDGGNGVLTAIPNLDPGERVPPCSIIYFAVKEEAGIVYVWSGAPDSVVNELPLATPDYQSGLREFTGHRRVAIEHTEFVAALLDGPELVIDMLGVHFGEKPQGDPRIVDGYVVTERNVYWDWLGESRFYIGPLRHRADYPLLLISKTAPVTGLTLLQVATIDGQSLAEWLIVPSPWTRSVTDVHWRASIAETAQGKAAVVLKALSRIGVSPFRVRKAIDGEALADLLPGPANTWRQLSDSQSLIQPGPAVIASAG